MCVCACARVAQFEPHAVCLCEEALVCVVVCACGKDTTGKENMRVYVCMQEDVREGQGDNNVNLQD